MEMNGIKHDIIGFDHNGNQQSTEWEGKMIFEIKNINKKVYLAITSLDYKISWHCIYPYFTLQLWACVQAKWFHCNLLNKLFQVLIMIQKYAHCAFFLFLFHINQF